MRMALINLDSGLFFEKGGWSADPKLAQTFSNSEAVKQLVAENKTPNAAVVLLDGDPPQARGFFWIPNLNRDSIKLGCHRDTSSEQPDKGTSWSGLS